jgi:hypothetical protein
MRDNLNSSDGHDTIKPKVKFEGIDQQKAKSVWDKLQQHNGTSDQILQCSRSCLKFLCIRAQDPNDYMIDKKRGIYYMITVFPPTFASLTSGPKVRPLGEITLIQEKDGSFTVSQDLSAVLESKIGLTADMVNSLLNQMATSVKEANKDDETKGVICKTRDKIH